jgi:hypothetical protein
MPIRNTIEDKEVQCAETAFRQSPVDQHEQQHRGKADEVDIGMEMRLLEARVDADPDAEGKSESAVKKPDQRSTLLIGSAP